MSKEVDYVVVGQGIAGSLLVDHLLERGKTFIVYDQGHKGSSTNNAAGIINPVTGRRYVKSWLFDELLTDALSHYRRLEKELGIKLIYQKNIIRSIPDQKTLNDWLAKSAWPDYEKYVVLSPDLATFEPALELGGIWSEVTNSFQIDLPLLICEMRKKLIDRGILRPERLDQQQIGFGKNGITYQDLSAKNIIFCEGSYVIKNRFFPGQSFLNPSKGENLLLKIPGFYPSKMIKKKYFLVHLPDGLFWFGAKDGWHFSDDSPSEEGYEFLLRQASKLINIPFEIVEHRAAIRPTIRDRRPVIGSHPDLKGVYLFNGFGTKGASLGPHWAKRLIEHIERGVPLENILDPYRFAN
ncbi:MAG: FAD-binding oxidoreductase [Saprospiraceae bacterium]|nr:FAD-binding oxidoreductase [Saprospiraceae bacterium]